MRRILDGGPPVREARSDVVATRVTAGAPGAAPASPKWRHVGTSGRSPHSRGRARGPTLGAPGGPPRPLRRTSGGARLERPMAVRRLAPPAAIRTRTALLAGRSFRGRSGNDRDRGNVATPRVRRRVHRLSPGRADPAGARRPIAGRVRAGRLSVRNACRGPMAGRGDPPTPGGAGPARPWRIDPIRDLPGRSGASRGSARPRTRPARCRAGSASDPPTRRRRRGPVPPRHPGSPAWSRDRR